MKYILLVSFLLLVGCSATERKEPTPFVVSDKRVIVVGCENLKQEVREWNEANPTLQPKKADC